MVAIIPINSEKTPQTFSAPLQIEKGVKPLYFTFRGKGRLNFYTLSF